MGELVLGTAEGPGAAVRRAVAALVVLLLAAAVTLGAADPAAAALDKDWLHVLQVVADVNADPPDVPAVYLLGGSAARECSVDDRTWSDQVARRGVVPIFACNLASKYRSFALDLALVRTLPDVPTVVFIGINLGRFNHGVSHPTVELPPPAPLPAYYQLHHYGVDDVRSVAQKREQLQDWVTRRYPVFRERYAYNLGVLAQLVAACKRRHLHPVLLDLPRNMAIIGHALDAPLATYHAGCRALAARYDVPWVDFVDQARLVNGDFRDLWHLVEPGREKWQRLLSARTVALLRAYAMDGGETVSGGATVSEAATQ